MNMDSTHPSINDLKARAKTRLPGFVWEFLDSATGSEGTKTRNRAGLDQVCLRQAALVGEFTPDLGATLLGRSYALPVGIAPVGMSGLIWPGAEPMLAQVAATAGLPYTLSTVASRTPEDLSPHIGDQGWFQLYTPRDTGIRRDMLNRAKAAGFHTLVVTLDVPAASRRERQRRSGLQHPPKLTPRLFAQCMMRPDWSLRMLRNGMPRLKFMEEYQASIGNHGSTEHVGYQLRGSPDMAYLLDTMAEWDGPVIAKGVMRPDAAVQLRDAGVDAVWVSNHAGRQLDGSPASIEVLPEIRAAVGPDYPLLFDSGVESGLDVLRAIALGADFVMLGRAFHYGLAAFGSAGAAHVLHILSEDITSSMIQIGARRLSEVSAALWPGPPVVSG
ncbi:alpha-hydroxy acid oxidase [Pseudoruegeria sp. SK021]|uniref:alpha-hydroxy acid oxidase n=1 Tax=Pseudoruegeria sp. SK021 TaxID=1933035 RepID=UPI000A25FCCF|nr:alpha-hydroxy acid oxidase [Pseudoruegeria sp. SK021]OSP53696.1 alpha-hydroxy-acid oxidizing enzyme [Pseudoruegeria sp. SK021]